MASQVSTFIADASRRVEPLIRWLNEAFKRSPVGFTATVAAVGLSSAWLRSNYLEFMALGPGGLPYNVRGWLIALVFKALSRETTSTKEYDRDPDRSSWIDDAESLPERHGLRPKSGFHVAPARQYDQIPSKEMMQVSVTFRSCARNAYK
jgi:hypothetical protein